MIDILLLLWGLALLAMVTAQVWLTHKRLPPKKKYIRKKPKVAPPPAGQPVKRHRAITAEELQERE